MAVPSSLSGSGQEQPLDRLLELLDLETIELNVFRGYSPPETKTRVFGGQVAAQSLVAASRTVDPAMPVHSLHAYFLRPGNPSMPIVYEVDRLRDGRSYTTRRVVGIQGGKAIFNLQASFHAPEAGYEHQAPAPDVPGPDQAVPRDESDLPEDVRLDFLHSVRPIEARTVPDDDPYHRRVWIRANGTMGDDPVLHTCVLTYLSDLTLLGVTVGPHLADNERPGMMASLDHAMWFLRPCRADEWLLYDQETASASSGRGLARGRIWTRDGVLAASVVQEGVIRPPR
ncbi:acyl-CoA thioesterase [Acidiferrimicrobium sp. IK]|uniref:acyl-CoA thioesterase n=1 Tax=Acidiferrimicrobium sp. IK TaxID=2871700 RepID=UPI0021CB9440|nr:acyl-CoA thioesterase II [Acidiferrimicrobium sp. IK]